MATLNVLFCNTPEVNLSFYCTGHIEKCFKHGPENINMISKRTKKTNLGRGSSLTEKSDGQYTNRVDFRQSGLSETVLLLSQDFDAHLFLPNWYRKGINLQQVKMQMGTS